jgi:anaerobic magnesium-protoporphyrin IX monomethyl ester cyclase
MKIHLLSTNTFPSDQGLRTLSACLKREGHEVKMIFLPLGTWDYAENYSKGVMNQLKEETKDSKLIGINAMASTTKRAEQLINFFKELDIPTVWGGPHPTFFPDKSFELCDMVMVGEAEEAFIELAEKLEKKEDLSKIGNLYVRINGEEFKNPVRELIKRDLDWLAHPDYDIEDHKIIENNELINFEERHLNGMIFFQTERGCPQACSFCTNNIMRDLYKGKGELLRTHSVDYVIKELKRLKDKFPSIGVFDIRDETFTIRNIEWLREFCKRYKEEIGIRFKCLAEPASMSSESMSEEKMRLLVDAGLTDIIIGIQSGSDRVNFEVYNRFITKEQLLKCANVSSKFSDKLAVMYDIITSNPYENSDDILQSIKLVMQIPPPFYLSVNNLIYFEGTPLYRKALEDGYIKTEKDSASSLNYWDRWAHIKLKKKNEYLTLMLNLMRGPSTKKRIGLMPRRLLNYLIKENVVDYNLKHLKPTYLAGGLVSYMDYVREHGLKPLYSKMPVNFKMWYDKIRYHA